MAKKVNEMEDGRGFPFRVPAKKVNITEFKIYLETVDCDKGDVDVWKWCVETGTYPSNGSYKEFDSFNEALEYVASFARG